MVRRMTRRTRRYGVFSTKKTYFRIQLTRDSDDAVALGIVWVASLSTRDAIVTLSRAY